jgi:hypothetical protein
MSKNNICVYPHQCQFPRCNCDQPHKAEKRYPRTGVWPYIDPAKGGVAGKPIAEPLKAYAPEVNSRVWQAGDYHPNPFSGSYTVFKGYADVASMNPPSGGPSETAPDDRNSDGKNRHGCGYTDCGCETPCTPKTEQYVYYVGVQGFARSVASAVLEEAKTDFFRQNPHVNRASYVFIMDRGSSSNRLEKFD